CARPLAAARRWQAGSRRRTAVLEVSPFQSTMERLLGQLSNRVTPVSEEGADCFPAWRGCQGARATFSCGLATISEARGPSARRQRLIVRDVAHEQRSLRDG